MFGRNSHISIPPSPPGENEADYMNRKSFHSIILQAECCHDRLFMDINCGWPGRVNDARVFRNSKVCQCKAQLCRPNHLVGDEAYPLSPYLIKPYRERLLTKSLQCQGCNLTCFQCTKRKISAPVTPSTWLILNAL